MTPFGAISSILFLNEPYAALIDDAIWTSGYNFSSGDGYKTPDRLYLPYDKFNGWADDNYLDHTTPTYVAKKVPLPLDQANDTYKKGDAIFYSVAYNKDGTHTVYEDINLTNAGCLVKAPIAQVAPNRTYIRLTDKDQPANYVTYFMQYTTTPTYSASKLDTTQDAVDVYLDPVTKSLVALIVSAPDPVAAPTYSDDYYYVTDVAVNVGQTEMVDGDTVYSLKFVATAYNAKTGAATQIDLDYTLKDGATQPVSGKWYVEKIGDLLVNITVNATDATDIKSMAQYSVRSTEEDTDDSYVFDYDAKVYTVNKDVAILLDGDLHEGVVGHPMVLVDSDKKFVVDSHKNLVFFIEVGTTPYILDLYSGYKSSDTEAIYKAMASTTVSVKKPEDFDPDLVYDAYSTLEELVNANRAYALIDPEDIGVIYTAWGAPEVTPPAKVYRLSDLEHQFIKYASGKATYLLSWPDSIAEDDSTVGTAKYIDSGIFDKGETSSVVKEFGWNGEYYVTANTLVYSLKGEPDTVTGYKNIRYAGTYRFNEFESFGTNDPNRDVLVTFVNTGTDLNPRYRVSYITVISNDAVPNSHPMSTAFYGIFCGLDERGSTNVVNFVDPNTNTMKGLPLTASAAIYYNELIKSADVGDVLKITTDATGTTITAIDCYVKPGKVIEQNSNYIDSWQFVYDYVANKWPDNPVKVHMNLYDAAYYYVAADYIERVDPMKADTNDLVGVFQNSNGTTVVVIYSQDFLESRKDGDLFYGNIDEFWDGRK